MLTGSNSRDFGQGWGERYRPVREGETVVCKFRFRPNFESGNYLLTIGVAADSGGELRPLDRRYDSILLKVENGGPYFGLVSVGATCEFVRAVD
jgi:lipopolysaccharide transport system ATP-binding protein